MKTRNYIILSALALTSALALSSCSKNFDEAQGVSTAIGNAISVNAMVGSNVTTKAFAADQNTTSDALTGINLSAWNGSTAAITNATYTKSDNKWSTSAGNYYWQVGAYTFIGWAKNNEAATAAAILGSGAAESPEQVTGSYTVEASVNNGTNKPEKQNDPVLAVATCSSKPDNNSVDLKFQHLLSRISVNVYAPQFTENTVCLLDFGFSSVSTSGTFTYATTVATDNAFVSSCWSGQSSGNVGEWADGDDDTNTNYWWTANTGSGDAQTPSATYPPIVPRSLDTSFPKLTYYTTSGDTGTEVTSAPWLNVIPGSDIADNLQIRLNILQKEGSEASAAWHVRTLKVALSDLKVGDETLTEYKPGYQYVYNIRVLGQNTDDAEVAKAEVSVQGVTATLWNTQSTAQTNSSNIGVGNSLQDLIDKIVAEGGYGTIQLSKDVVLDTTVVIPDGCNVTIDLNGHNITTKDGTTVDPMFDVKGGGELTFDDSSTGEPGSVTAAKGTTIIKLEDGDSSTDGGKATINNGEFDVSGDEGYLIESTDNAYHGTSVINGGTINKDGYEDEDKKSPFSGTDHVINGGTFTGGYMPSATSDYIYIKTSDNPVTYVAVPAAEVLSTSTIGSEDVTAD